MLTTDSPLRTRLLVEFQANPHIRRRDLHIEDDDGRVTLRGVVNSYYQKQMAQEAIRRIDGVSQIENLLEVGWA